MSRLIAGLLLYAGSLVLISAQTPPTVQAVARHAPFERWDNVIVLAHECHP